MNNYGEIVKEYKIFEEFEKTEEILKNSFYKAYNFAKEVHKNQTRDEGIPYFTHIEGIIEILKNEFDMDYNTALTIACLHDVLEDSDYTYDDLVEMFDPFIADSVKALTKTKDMSMEDYIKQLNEFEDPEFIWAIKLADRLHNLRSLKSIINTKKDKVKKYIEETYKYYMPIASDLSKTDHDIFEAIYIALKEIEDMFYSEKEKKAIYEEAMNIPEDELNGKIEELRGIKRRIYTDVQSDLRGARLKAELWEGVKQGHEYMYHTEEGKTFLVTLNGEIELTEEQVKEKQKEIDKKYTKNLIKRGIE